jgi:hypothetical protein
LKKTLDLISEEEIDELNKDKYEEAINCLKKHEDEVRFLRQELEAELRQYNNEIYLKHLIEKRRSSKR